MVQNLHELSSFFQEDPAVGSVPHRQLEARVAAILAKSTTEAVDRDVPQTPFVDVFNVGGLSPTYEDSEDSETDSEDSDLFEYDSPDFARFMQGLGTGAHPHVNGAAAA